MLTIRRSVSKLLNKMSSGFVSEKVLEEKRQERQAEWEKVRKPHEPEQAPEEPVETRSLFEQLNANRMKDQEEFEESRKLKNQIRGIDDDEAEFLDAVDDVRTRMEREKRLEEKRELEEYRKGQAELREKELEERLKASSTAVSRPIVNKAKSSSSQSKLLLGAVKRSNSNKKSAEETGNSSTPAKVTKKEDSPPKNALGALAGLGDYDSSSSNSDEESANS